MSTTHTVVKAQKQDAHDKSSSSEAPRSAVSWRSYTLHILFSIVFIEGFILAYIYKRSNISGLFLDVLIGFVGIVFVLILMRILIEILVEIKIKVMEKEVIEYIAYKKAANVKAVQQPIAVKEIRQKIKAY